MDINGKYRETLDAYNSLCGLESRNSPAESRIFNEEIKRAGLEGVAIELLMPESSKHSYKGKIPANAYGNFVSGYTIEMQVSPGGIEGNLSDENTLMDKIINEGLLDLYEGMNYLDIFQESLRDELVRIKWGVVDFFWCVEKTFDIASWPIRKLTKK